MLTYPCLWVPAQFVKGAVTAHTLTMQSQSKALHQDAGMCNTSLVFLLSDLTLLCSCVRREKWCCSSCGGKKRMARSLCCCTAPSIARPACRLPAGPGGNPSGLRSAYLHCTTESRRNAYIAESGVDDGCVVLCQSCDTQDHQVPQALAPTDCCASRHDRVMMCCGGLLGQVVTNVPYGLAGMSYTCETRNVMYAGDCVMPELQQFFNALSCHISVWDMLF